MKEICCPKFLKRALCLVVVLAMMLYPVQAQAATSFKYNFSTSTSSTAFYNYSSGIYGYYLYKGSGGAIIYTDKFVIDPIYHTKGTSGQRVTSSNTVSISTTKTWNAKIGGSYGNVNSLGYSASCGYGVTTGWSFTTQVSLIEREFKSAATGYYAIAAGMPNYYIKEVKKNGVTMKTISTKYFYMPHGTSTKFIVVSTDNQASWKVYGTGE